MDESEIERKVAEMEKFIHDGISDAFLSAFAPSEPPDIIGEMVADYCDIVIEKSEI